MNIQAIIAALIIVAAIAYAGVTLARKRHSFSIKKACANDCGCNGNTKKLTS